MTSEAFAAMTQEEQVTRLEGLGRAALAELDVQPIDIRPLVHMENTTFRVDSHQGVFNLRISRPGYQSTANVWSEIQWLNALREADFRVPEPYQGRLVTASVPEVPEPRDCVLFRWMEGEFVRRWNPRQAQEVGQVLGRLHRFVEDWPLPKGFDRAPLHKWAFGPRRPYPMDAPHPMVAEEDRQLLMRVDRETREMLSSLPRDPDRYRLIHADLHASNVLFDADGINVIDFDDTGFGFLYYDFASALAYQGEQEEYPAVRDGLLGGYAEVRPLPPDTEELLNPFLRMRLAGVANWVMEREDNPRMREEGPRMIAWFCEGIRRFGTIP